MRIKVSIIHLYLSLVALATAPINTTRVAGVWYAAFASPHLATSFAVRARISLAPRIASMSSSSDGLQDIGDFSAVDGSSRSSLAVEVVPWADRIAGSIAKSRKVRGGNYVQIATVDAHGHPRCRTVVFRGFQPVAERGGAQAFKMITDARSEKVGHVAGSARGELVWWFSKSSEQYRVAGTLELVGPAHASSELGSHRRQQWGNLSDNAREQFFWAGQPGEACGQGGGGSSPAPPVGGRDAEGVLLPPPDTFLLLLLWPEQVKYLRLTDNFSQVDKLEESAAAGGDGAWQAVRVNP